MKLLKLLTSRSTVIALFVAISTALLVASSVPQRASAGGKIPEWVGRLPENLRFLSTVLGLDDIVGSGWFAVLVALFWLSLIVSTMAQYSAAKALVQRIPQSIVPLDSIRINSSPDDIYALLKAAGYRESRSITGVHRYVKNRIGYWGNFLLHVGLVASVFFSLVYVVTKHRVLVRLTGQEITSLTPGNIQEIRGFLPLKQKLPATIFLNSLEPRFWENDKLERLSSELYFADKPGGEPQRVYIAVSDKSQYGQFTVYQANTFGRAYDLEFASADGNILRERLYLSYPQRRDVASYGEMGITGTDFILKAKFFADSERKTIKLHEPQLTMRLYRKKELLGESTLTQGGIAQMGPLVVRHVQSEWWTDIMLDGTHGTGGIFTGFALILTGVLASYCLVPREIIVFETVKGVYLHHITKRFAQFYREEFDDIIKRLRIER